VCTEIADVLAGNENRLRKLLGRKNAMSREYVSQKGGVKIIPLDAQLFVSYITRIRLQNLNRKDRIEIF
jgi:hypothetical protein